MSFADLVKNARIKKEWLQEDLAKRVGVTQTFISQIERGTVPKFDLACMLIKVLNLNTNQICNTGIQQYIEFLKEKRKWPLEIPIEEKALGSLGEDGRRREGKVSGKEST